MIFTVLFLESSAVVAVILALIENLAFAPSFLTDPLAVGGFLNVTSTGMPAAAGPYISTRSCGNLTHFPITPVHFAS